MFLMWIKKQKQVTTKPKQEEQMLKQFIFTMLTGLLQSSSLHNQPFELSTSCNFTTEQLHKFHPNLSSNPVTWVKVNVIQTELESNCRV